VAIFPKPIFPKFNFPNIKFPNGYLPEFHFFEDSFHLNQIFQIANFSESISSNSNSQVSF